MVRLALPTLPTSGLAGSPKLSSHLSWQFPARPAAYEANQSIQHSYATGDGTLPLVGIVTVPSGGRIDLV